jgi:large subunit ribosomal protein L4
MELQIKNASGAASGQLTVADEVFARPFNEGVGPSGGGGLSGRCPCRYPRAENSRPGQRRRRQTVSAERDRPRSRRQHSWSHVARWWRDLCGPAAGSLAESEPKMYRAAMRAIFSELLRQDRLLVVDALDLPEIKTKQMIARLTALGLG